MHEAGFNDISYLVSSDAFDLWQPKSAQFCQLYVQDRSFQELDKNPRSRTPKYRSFTAQCICIKHQHLGKNSLDY